MKTAEKITGIYEKKLIRRLLQSDQQTNMIYRQFIDRTAPILAKYRQNLNGVIIRNSSFDKQLKDELSRFQKGIETLITENQSWAWALSNEKTDQILQSFLGKTSVSKVVKKGLFQRNIDAFEAFQQRKQDGLQLSDRIWNLTNGNQNIMEYYLDNGISIGKSAPEIAAEVKQLLHDPEKVFRRVRDPKTGELKLSRNAQAYHPGQGKYRSSVQNARRLARTETNMAYRMADQERWKQLDFMLGYEVKLSNRHPAPDICDSAAGRYPIHFKFVGWHPNCLCYIVPILPDEDQFIDSLVDENVAITGHVTDIPDTMKTYIAKNQEKIQGWKKQPFWVQDNFKGGRIEKGLDLSALKAKPVEIIRKKSIPEMQEIMNRLDIPDSQKQSVRYYTRANYNEINGYYRGVYKTISDEALKNANNLDEFLKNAPKVETTSYRGIDASKSLFDQMKSLRKGDPYSDKAFISTTYDRKVVKDFSSSSQYQVELTIKGKNGVLIENLSVAKREKEILFGRGSKFKVEAIKVTESPTTGKILLSLVEL